MCLQVLQVVASFVSQLEGLKLPQWAVYVALHLPDSPQHAGLRRQVVRELLFRYAAELHAAETLHSLFWCRLVQSAGSVCVRRCRLATSNDLPWLQPFGHNVGYRLVRLATCCSLARCREMQQR